MSRMLWLPVGVTAACQAVGIFFGAQSMYLARSLTVEGGAWVAMAVGFLIVMRGLRKVESKDAVSP